MLILLYVTYGYYKKLYIRFILYFHVNKLKLGDNYEILQKEQLDYFFQYPYEDFIIGLRFARYIDCQQISYLYLDEYGYNYVNPLVYSQAKLLLKISDTKKNIWIVGENINNGEIAAASLLEIRENILFSSKTILNPKYRGMGLGSVLSYNSVTKIHKLGLLEGYIKIDSDVRAVQSGAQKLTESANGVAYGFIPDYNLFGDKRYYIQDIYNPFQDGYPESAFLYFAVLPRLFKVREPNIILLDNNYISFLYNYLKKFKLSMKIVMKNDKLSIESSNGKLNKEQINLSLNPLNSIVNLEGISNHESIEKILNQFNKYHIIIWKIPTTLNGVSSMQTALDLNFKVVGYDMASIKDDESNRFHDSIIFCHYANGIHEDFKKIKTTPKNKPLVEKISSQFC